jgi:hypothetical protein
MNKVKHTYDLTTTLTTLTPFNYSNYPLLL